MAKLTLVIGSKNLCQFSLGPWLLLKQSGIVFEEQVIRLDATDAAVQIARFSPSGRVPVLLVDEVPIWDSLAIAEFLAEHVTNLWPVDPQTRAEARSISAEMHSEFQALRDYMPMDFVGRFGSPGKLLFAVERDIGRIQAIWLEFRRRFAAQGPFLCGAFSIADAMFAPACAKFTTHSVTLQPEADAYRQTVMSLPAIQEWASAAALEGASAPPMARVEPSAPEAPPTSVSAPSITRELPPPPLMPSIPVATTPSPVSPAPVMPRVDHAIEPPTSAAPARPEALPTPAAAPVPERPTALDDGPPKPRRHWLRSPMFREQRAREAATVDSTDGEPDVEESSDPVRPMSETETRPDTPMIKPIGAGIHRRR